MQNVRLAHRWAGVSAYIGNRSPAGGRPIHVSHNVRSMTTMGYLLTVAVVALIIGIAEEMPTYYDPANR